MLHQNLADTARSAPRLGKLGDLDDLAACLEVKLQPRKLDLAPARAEWPF
jgi:hypothetical protein